MAQSSCKNKSKKIIVKEYEELVDDDEGFQIEDVSGWLEQVDSNEADEDDLFHNELPDSKTPERQSQISEIDLLKSSPQSPLLYQYSKRQREIPLTKPTPPVFKREEFEDSEDYFAESSSRASSDKRKNTAMVLTNDLDLDASVSVIFNSHKRSRTQKNNDTKDKNKGASSVKKVMMECPICSRMFAKEKIEVHASDCTGAYSDSDEENDSPSFSSSENHGTKKKTMANGIAHSEAIRKRKYKNITQIPINYYLQSEDMVATDGGDFASSSAGLNWESAGQTRFS